MSKINLALFDQLKLIHDVTESDSMVNILPITPSGPTMLHAFDMFGWELYRYDNKYLVDKSLRKVELDIKYGTSKETILNMITQGININKYDSLCVFNSDVRDRRTTRDIESLLKDVVFESHNVRLYYPVKRVILNGDDICKTDIVRRYLLIRKGR